MLDRLKKLMGLKIYVHMIFYGHKCCCIEIFLLHHLWQTSSATTSTRCVPRTANCDVTNLVHIYGRQKFLYLYMSSRVNEFETVLAMIATD